MRTRPPSRRSAEIVVSEAAPASMRGTATGGRQGVSEYLRACAQEGGPLATRAFLPPHWVVAADALWSNISNMLQMHMCRYDGWRRPETERRPALASSVTRQPTAGDDRPPPCAGGGARGTKGTRKYIRRRTKKCTICTAHTVKLYILYHARLSESRSSRWRRLTQPPRFIINRAASNR